MAFPPPDVYRVAPQRYTRPQLFQICRNSKVPFDLSRFTYDAARAGVVPPLGECAMPSRRTSGQRPRGWSTESLDTNDDVVVFHGTNSRSRMSSSGEQPPVRQPSGPPGETKAQKDEGFARFLEKHSSPTHNRVTAGGRIVPMEKRESPPKFSLPGQKLEAEPLQELVKQECGYSASMFATPLNIDTNLSSPIQHPTPTIDEASHQIIAGADESQAGNASHESPVTQQASFLPSLPVAMPLIDPYNTASNAQLQIGGCYLPQVPVFPGSPSLAPFTWQYADPTAFPWANQNIASELESSTPQYIATTQQCLVQAEALYNDLDRQLKLIDRHRAMSSHDPSLAIQRMAIVQQRADVKDTVARFKTLLAEAANVGVGQRPISLTYPVNFAAAATGAQAWQQSNAPVATTPASIANNNLNIGVSATNDVLHVRQKSASISKRKIIPIVSPQSSMPRQLAIEKGNQVVAASIVPPLLNDSQGGQSLDTNVNGCDSSSPTKLHSTCSALVERTVHPDIAVPTLFSNSTAHSDGDGCQDDKGGEPTALAEKHSQWTGLKTGTAPPGFEDWYELHLNALRLPIGVRTKFSLENGTIFELDGTNLSKPEPCDMTEFEKRYWTENPSFTMTMLQHLMSKAEVVEFEKYEPDFLLGKVCQDASGYENPCGSSSGGDALVVQRPVGPALNDSGPDVLSPLTKSMAVVTNRATETGKGETAVATQKITETTLADNKPGNEHVETVEQMSNKGFTSAIVQSIHVTAQLPPSVDGATEHGRRNAKSMLAAANRSRSPRVLQRSTASGKAWFGPHCREVRARTMSDADERVP